MAIRPINLAGDDATLLDIKHGKVPGHKIQYVHAYSPNIGTTQELVWPLGGNITFNDTPSTLYLTSTNAADNQYVQIEWLDGDYLPVTSLVQLNGQTPVAIGTGLRVNRAFTVAVTPTIGDVYIANANNHTSGVPNDATEVVMYYEASTQTRSMALFTCPAGHTTFGLTGYFSAPKSRDNDFFWNVRNPNLPIPPINTNIVSVYESTVELDFKLTDIPAKTDAYFTSSTSGGNGRVSLRIPILIVDNDYI